MNYQKDLKKIIWKLFKMDRSDFNMFDFKVEIILFKVFEKGRKLGREEEAKRIKKLIN